MCRGSPSPAAPEGYYSQTDPYQAAPGYSQDPYSSYYDYYSQYYPSYGASSSYPSTSYAQPPQPYSAYPYSSHQYPYPPDYYGAHGYSSYPGASTDPASSYFGHGSAYPGSHPYGTSSHSHSHPHHHQHTVGAYGTQVLNAQQNSKGSSSREAARAGPGRQQRVQGAEVTGTAGALHSAVDSSAGAPADGLPDYEDDEVSSERLWGKPVGASEQQQGQNQEEAAEDGASDVSSLDIPDDGDLDDRAAQLLDGLVLQLPEPQPGQAQGQPPSGSKPSQRPKGTTQAAAAAAGRAGASTEPGLQAQQAPTQHPTDPFYSYYHQQQGAYGYPSGYDQYYGYSHPRPHDYSYGHHHRSAGHGHGSGYSHGSGCSHCPVCDYNMQYRAWLQHYHHWYKQYAAWLEYVDSHEK